MVDMLACNWERKLGGGEGVTAEMIGDVAEGFLERYLPEDREIARELCSRKLGIQDCKIDQHILLVVTW